jgi:hypothetical protein
MSNNTERNEAERSVFLPYLYEKGLSEQEVQDALALLNGLYYAMLDELRESGLDRTCNIKITRTGHIEIGKIA